MPAIKTPNKWDVYMSATDIAENFNISKKVIYEFRNSNKVRWIKNTVNFHVDDIRDCIKKYWVIDCTTDEL